MKMPALKIPPLSQRDRVLLLVIAVGGVWVFNKYYLSPRNQQIAQKQKEVEEKRRKVEQMEAREKQLPILEAQLGRLQRQEKQIEKRLPREKDLPGLLRIFSEVARKHDVAMPTIIPQAPTARDFYTEHPFRVTLTGSYHSLGSFFSSIGQLDRILTLHNLTLAPAGGEKTNVLNANVEIRAYVFP